MWITSSRVLPVIILVVLPMLTSILSIVLSYFVPIISSYTPENLIYAYSYLYIASTFTLAYAFYPIKLGNIKKRGFAELSSEYEYIKKILYFEVPILIISTFFFLGMSYPIGPYDRYDFRLFLSAINESLGFGTYPIYVIIVDPYGHTGQNTTYEVVRPTEKQVGSSMNYFVAALSINLALSVTAGIIFMVLVTARKELGYYVAKSLFQIIIQEKVESKKANYLIKAVKVYDKYLRGTLNLEINNTKKIYSKILADPNSNKNESMRLISESFESSDKLEPVKSLSKIAYDKDDKDTFLVEESISKRIKDMAIFFATIIPVAVAVIQLLLQK